MRVLLLFRDISGSSEPTYIEHDLKQYELWS